MDDKIDNQEEQETKSRKPPGYWNDYYHNREEALKFSSLSEFYHCNASAYDAARRNNYIGEYEWLARKQKPVGYWDDYEVNYREALKYCSRGEYSKNSPVAWRYAKKNGWIDEYYWLKDERFDLINDKIDCVYSYEFIEQNSAYIGRTLMKNKNKRDYEHMFQERDTVYKFAKENNVSIPNPKYLEENLTIKEGRDRECFWIDEYKRLGWIVLNKAKGGSIGRIGHKFSKYTYDVCYEIAKECDSRKTFEKRNKSAYQVAVKNKWIDDYDWFISYCKPNGYWTKERCLEESKKYLTRSEWKHNSNGSYHAACVNGWVDECVWFENKIVKRGYWQNRENCYKTAKKIKTITELIVSYPGLYKSAKEHDWLSDYTWLVNGRITGNKKDWDYNSFIIESKKYISLKDFKKHSASAYIFGQRNGWLDECTWLDKPSRKKKNT